MSDNNNARPKFYDHINVYDFNCKLPGDGQEVKFKPVITGQLKKLLTYENETNLLIQEQALDDMILSCVTSENFNLDELYLEDRFYLLVELRKKTKGEVLEFSLNCPQCKSQSLNKVDLNNLPVTPLDEKKNESIVNIGNGIKVYLRRLKRKHQKEIKASMIHEHLSDIQKQAEIQILYHACAIDKVESPDGIEDNLNITAKQYLIENITTGEYDKIRKALEEMSFGLDLTYAIKCRQCNFEHKTLVPVENNFFS